MRYARDQFDIIIFCKDIDSYDWHSKVKPDDSDRIREFKVKIEKDYGGNFGYNMNIINKIQEFEYKIGKFEEIKEILSNIKFNTIGQLDFPKNEKFEEFVQKILEEYGN